MTRRMERTLMMLILTRRPGETVAIGRSFKLKIVQAGGKQIRIGINAPKELPIRAESGMEPTIRNWTLTRARRG
jgi:carbon storage regulator